MAVESGGAVTFIGTSNVMKSNMAPDNKGKNIYSLSNDLKFSVCKPGTASPGTLDGNLEVDFDGCLVELCAWHETNDGAIAGTTGTHLVPAAGCKMSKQIVVYGDMTFKGVSGSYHQLQSNRVDDKDGTASSGHRHFNLEATGKLTLNYLKLTWGEVGGNRNGGFIQMNSGTLSINFVHFDGSKTTGNHGHSGGCIRVIDGIVTIKESIFEGFSALWGGAMFVVQTSIPMTIESTTFQNNEATVRFLSLIFRDIKFQEINL